MVMSHACRGFFYALIAITDKELLKLLKEEQPELTKAVYDIFDKFQKKQRS